MTPTFDNDQIQQLLASVEPEFHAVGVQHLIAGLPETYPAALTYLAQCPEERAISFAATLKRYSPFLRPGFAPPMPQKSAPYQLFDCVRRNLDGFCSALRQMLLETPRPHQDQLLQRLAGFPGVAVEIREMLDELQQTEQRAVFETCVHQAQRNHFRRQLMLFLSYRCNLHCSYCFVHTLDEPDMSVSTARALLDWAQANDVTTITFCGGEPTIYPAFPVLLDELAVRGLRTYFATNLLTGPGVLERLRPALVDSLIVHVAHPETYQGSQWTMFQEHVNTVLQQGVPFALRINMYAGDHDWSPLFELASKFGLKEVQLALTFPNAGRNNQFVRVEEFSALIPAVIRFMQTCTNHGLRVVWSKPLPLCLFPETMQAALLHQHKYTPTCSVFQDGYTHNVCITPAGNVTPCLALLDRSQSFADVQQWDDLSVFCQAELAPLLSQPLFDQCAECFLFARRLCQGACVGHKKLCNSTAVPIPSHKWPG